jgi:FemAB-related protein (PEP-CTERM system-associated)
MIDVRVHPESLAGAWDDYVRRHPEASSYHLWGWKGVLGPGLGHRSHYLSAWRDDRLCGVLPMVHMNRPLLGRLLVSLPFVNYGGIVADDAEVGRALTDGAVHLARALRVDELELRHQRQDVTPLPARAHRISLSLPLPPSVDALWKGIGPKLRNQVRKADRSGLVASRGGIEELDAFYEVFVQNMRDLGSPVWPKRFFRHMLRTFPDRVRLYRVDLERRPVAVGFVFRFRQTVEIPWASSLREYNGLCANVRLYWQMIADAVREGYEWFDFGRSARGGGTHKFKLQWGAIERPLYWHHWPGDESGDQAASHALEGQRRALEAA